MFEEDTAFPEDVGDHDCLIAVQASSLNFRDIMIANVRLVALFMSKWAL